MIDNSKLFKLREEHIRYIKKLMSEREEQFFFKYGIEYKSILINDDTDKKDREEYSIIRYISQRADILIEEYDRIFKEKDSI